MTNATHPAHLNLLDLGFTHQYVDPEWGDIGGPESGPKISGHPGFHQYSLDDLWVYIDNDGSTGFEQWDPTGSFPIAASYP